MFSFIVAAIILKFTKEPEEDLEAATEKMEASKGKKSSVSSKLKGNEDSNTTSTAGVAGATTTNSDSTDTQSEEDLLDNYDTENVDAHDYSKVNHVIFACDAGMGSSAMGASMLRNKFKKADIQDVDVTNTAINQLPSDAQLVITQKKLTDRAIKQVPNAIHISVDNFLNSPRYDELLENLK